MSYRVQLSRRKASDNRHPRATDPVYELELADNERIVSVVYEWMTDSNRRETVDHTVTLLIETRLT